MPVSYSSKLSDLHAFAIPDHMLLAIGRLMRATAEIEDIINLYLCKIAGIGEGQSTLLLGVTPISKKILLARSFASAQGAERLKFHTDLFENDVFREILRSRNIAAHGVLLGLSDEGLVTFRTLAVSGSDPDRVHVEAVSLTPRHFGMVAETAEQAVTQLEAYLEVQALRETRRWQALNPHGKAQPKRPPSAAHSRGPKPSRE